MQNDQKKSKNKKEANWNETILSSDETKQNETKLNTNNHDYVQDWISQAEYKQRIDCKAKTNSCT